MTSYEIDTLAAHLSAPYYLVNSPDQEDYQPDDDTDDQDYQRATIARVTVQPRQQDPSSLLHPVKYPLLDMLSVAPLTTADLPTASPQPARVNITRVHHDGVHLADTGATVSATGMRHILHDFTPHTKYEITGYDGISTPAHGEGYKKMPMYGIR